MTIADLFRGTTGEYVEKDIHPEEGLVYSGRFMRKAKDALGMAHHYAFGGGDSSGGVPAIIRLHEVDLMKVSPELAHSEHAYFHFDAINQRRIEEGNDDRLEDITIYRGEELISFIEEVCDEEKWSMSIDKVVKWVFNNIQPYEIAHP